MNHLAQISALVGTFLPLLVSVVQQRHWSQKVQTYVGVAMCVVAAVVTTLAEDKFNWHDLATSLFYIFTLTKVTYRNVWKPTGIAPAIEDKTTVAAP